jgi:hypothetical protein
MLLLNPKASIELNVSAGFMRFSRVVLQLMVYAKLGAFMDSTGIGRARVAGSRESSASSTLKPIKRQTTNKLRFRSLRNCVRASTQHRPCDWIRG